MVADLGFGDVNICVSLPSSFFLGSDTPEHLDALRRPLAVRGLLMDSETQWTDPAYLTRLLVIGRHLEAGHPRTYTPRAEAPREQVERAVRDVARMGPLAKRAGIPIFAENHEDLTATEGFEILERVDHSWTQTLFDLRNPVAILEEPAKSIRLLDPFACTAHLEDNLILPAGAVGPDVLFMGAPLAEGKLPIVATTHALIAAGIERICFENGSAYHTRFRYRRGQGVLGQGACAYRQSTDEPRILLPELEATRVRRVSISSRSSARR